MEPIVSPWFVYLLGQVGIFNEFVGVGAVIGGILLIALLGAGFGFKNDAKTAKKWDREDDADKDLARGQMCHRWCSKLCIPWLILLFFAIFTPSRNTIIGMYAANEITYDRVGQAAEITKNLKDELKKDMLDIINSIGK